MARAPTTLLIFLTAVSAISPRYGALITPRDAGACPASYSKCSNANLPDNFCCPTSATCVSLDEGSSVICCPEGHSCDYIEPISCNVQLQNAALHPKNAVKTTKLNGRLPTCGDSCCPFGYSCQGNNLCAMDNGSTSSTTNTESSTSTEKTFPTKTAAPTTTETKSESQTTSSFTTVKSTAGEPPTITSDTTVPTFIYSSNYPRVSSSKIAVAGSSSSLSSSTCPSFPTQAVVAGFFPGAACGAALALLLALCIRRYKENHLPASVRVAQNTKRTSTGTLIGISDPIPSEDSACRTDFLLSQAPKRNSEGARSMLHRTGTRVKSLFGGTPKITLRTPDGTSIKDVPPPLPIMPPRKALPRRQPSTESIKVYTPPGVFASTAVLKPEPYPNAAQRPNTTFSDMIHRSREDAGPEIPRKDGGLRVPRG
ncbi:hypothetical protein BDV59DRAFT_181651 [Aspergillus ambiguus]|uniref:uncharacterized protein n=1 Tax=Aspergillus ambiguus TaxID=176160 RepID=UPI003CCDA242